MASVDRCICFTGHRSWAGCHERDEAWRRGGAEPGEEMPSFGMALSRMSHCGSSPRRRILGFTVVRVLSSCRPAHSAPLVSPPRAGNLSRPCVRRSLHQGIRTTRDGCVHSEGINRMASGCVRQRWSSGSHPADASMPFTQTNSLLAILLPCHS
jgi:hypothetical protein